MINDRTSITLAEIKTVLNSLKQQRDIINKSYSSDIKKVLESSNVCFQVAGLDTTEINQTIESTFKSINKNMNGLIDVLENDVIKNYTEVTAAVKQMFGSSFAAKISELLNLS